MERQPASRKTSKLLAYRLHHALHSGSLREVVDELANPTCQWPTSPPPFPRQPTQAPMSAFDSSIYDGTNLLGAAATALLLPAAFRLAVFALLLERGANPHAAGENGMPAEWVLYRLKDEPEVRDWCLGELEQATVDQYNMVRYEAPTETQDWIVNELAALDAEAEQAQEPVSDEDTPMQDYEPDNLADPEPIKPPPAKRPRSPSPLPDYEDVQPLAPRAFGQPHAYDSHRAAGSAIERDEHVQDPPRPTPTGAGPRPSPSAPFGLTRHEAHVFEPLIDTLLRHRNGVALASMVGQELRQRYSNVYDRDPDLSTWRLYIVRAVDLGVVEFVRGAIQGQDWVRLHPSHLRNTSQRFTTVPSTSSRPQLAQGPPARPFRPARTSPPPPSPPRPRASVHVDAPLRRPPPPPPPPPHEPVLPPPPTASAADAAPASTSTGSSRSAAAHPSSEPSRAASSGSSALSQPYREPSSLPRPAPEPTDVDRQEPGLVKRPRSPSAVPEEQVVEPAAKRQMVMAPLAVPIDVLQPVEDPKPALEPPRPAPAPTPAAAPPAAIPAPSREVSRLMDDEAYVFEPLIQTLRSMKARDRWVATKSVEQRLCSDFPYVYRRDPSLTSWKAYSDRAHTLCIVSIQVRSKRPSQICLTAEFATSRGRQPLPLPPTMPPTEQPERSTTFLPPRPSSLLLESVLSVPTPPSSVKAPVPHAAPTAPSPSANQGGAASATSSSTDQIGQSWRDFTASRQKPRTIGSSVPAASVPMVRPASTGASSSSSTSASAGAHPFAAAPSAAPAPLARTALSLLSSTARTREPSTASSSHGDASATETVGGAGRARAAASVSTAQPGRINLLDVLRPKSPHDAAQPAGVAAEGPAAVASSASGQVGGARRLGWRKAMPTVESPLGAAARSSAGASSEAALSRRCTPAARDEEPLEPKAVTDGLPQSSLEMSRPASSSSTPRSAVAATAVAPGSFLPAAERATDSPAPRPAPHARPPALYTSFGPEAVAHPLAYLLPASRAAAPPRSTSPVTRDRPPHLSAVPRQASQPRTTLEPPFAAFSSTPTSLAADAAATPSASGSALRAAASLGPAAERGAQRPAAAAPVSSADLPSLSTSRLPSPSARAGAAEAPAPSRTASPAAGGRAWSAAQSLGSASPSDISSTSRVTAAMPRPTDRSRLPSPARPPPLPADRPRPPSSTPRSLASSASPAPYSPSSSRPLSAQQTSAVRPGWAPSLPSTLDPSRSTVSASQASSSASPRHSVGRVASPFVPSASEPSVATAPALAVAGPAQPAAQPRVVGFVTMEVHRLPPYATDVVLKTYLLSGPSVFSSLSSAAHLDQLDALVRRGEFRPTAVQQQQQRAEAPPVSRRQQIVVEEKPGGRSARRWARVTYSTRADAERARALFDGKRLVEGPAGAGEATLVWMEQGNETARFRGTQSGP